MPGRLYGLSTGFPKRRQKVLPILVVLENWLPPVAPAHHMIDRTWILDSRSTRHLAEPPNSLTCRQPLSTIAGTDPFPISVLKQNHVHDATIPIQTTRESSGLCRNGKSARKVGTAGSPQTPMK